MRTVKALPFMQWPDTLARKASDVSATDWRYQTHVISSFSLELLRIFSGLEVFVNRAIFNIKAFQGTSILETTTYKKMLRRLQRARIPSLSEKTKGKNEKKKNWKKSDCYRVSLIEAFPHKLKKKKMIVSLGPLNRDRDSGRRWDRKELSFLCAKPPKKIGQTGPRKLFSVWKSTKFLI